jgi:hypothetical protein
MTRSPLRLASADGDLLGDALGQVAVGGVGTDQTEGQHGESDRDHHPR